MQFRRFGNTPLTVSEVGFGCARIGGVFSDTSRKDVLRLLRLAADCGVTFFDTADMYTQGESERLVGEAFRHDRQRIVIASKFGYVLPTQKALGSRIKPLLKPIVARLGLTGRHVPSALRGSVSRQDFSPSYIASAIEASLRRLRTDYIDVYQLHSPPPDVLRAGAFVETLERSREQGKIRYWGVACEHPEDVADCLAHAQIASVQVGFSALEQAALDSAIPQAARRGIGIISRQVYASGLLTRPIDAFEPCQIDDDTAVADRKREQIAALSAIAANTRRSRAELALKFALSQADVSVVLLGISRQAHLDDCLAALQTPDLTEQEQQMVMSARRPGR
jgi:aryl-alcohol dehydrogenase-like predicted oxidoreductase